MPDRYEIRGRLGRGGIGAVYNGFDTQLGREVAIKRLLPLEETQLNQADTGSLSREAAALAMFQHPNVVTIFGFEEDEDGPFVVTELIKGENLKVIIEKGALSVRDFQEFVSQTLDAMIAAEQMNLLHRDIKPANLMLLFLPSGKFQVKILDFGLAKFSQTPSAQTLDHKGSFLGSIDYIAPEQIERQPLDQRTDLYSLGCVCYFVLTQKAPFEGRNMAETMNNHLNHKVIPIGQIRPDLPQAIATWVMRMIAQKPGHRPSNATEAVEEFEQSKIGIAPELPGGDGSGQSATSSVPIAVTQAPSETSKISDDKFSGDSSPQPATAANRRILTGSQPLGSSSKKGSSTGGGGSQKNSRPVGTAGDHNMVGPYVVLGLAVILLIGGVAFIIKTVQKNKSRQVFVENRVVPKIEEKVPTAPTEPEEIVHVGTPLSDLEGIVVDDVAVKFVGNWVESVTAPYFVGKAYRHDNADGKGGKSAVFSTTLQKAGEYELYLSYTSGNNRASKIPVTIKCGETSQEMILNQRIPPKYRPYAPIGNVSAKAGDKLTVTISNEGATDGYVIVDSLQVLEAP